MLLFHCGAVCSYPFKSGLRSACSGCHIVFVSILIVFSAACKDAASDKKGETVSSRKPPARAKSPFVNVKRIIPDIVIDARYASTNNFTGKILRGYTRNSCWMLPGAARALKKVEASLQKQGLGLKVWDGYRPQRAQADMAEWAKQNMPGALGTYLRGPIYKRRFGHECGNTVDLTLIRLSNKQELDMGTPFDDFSKKAWTWNARGEVLANRKLLVRAMKQEGFENYNKEWWHFVNFRYPGNPKNLVIKP